MIVLYKFNRTTVVALATSIKPVEMKSFGCKSMNLVDSVKVSMRGAKSCAIKTIYMYQRSTVTSQIVTLTSTQDSEITQVISNLTYDQEIIFKTYLIRLKDRLNQTVVRDTVSNDFLMVEHEQYYHHDLSDIEPIFTDSKSFQIMSPDGYKEYLIQSGEVFFKLFSNKNKQHTDIIFMYMSIILSHMLSSNFQDIRDDNKYNDLLKKHKLCFLETKNYTVSRVLGEISDDSERFFAIKKFFERAKEKSDIKVKIELLKSINFETINKFNFLNDVKPTWSAEQVNLNEYHEKKYEIVLLDLKSFYKTWNNLSHELFRKGFRYLFGSFLIPAIKNNTCTQDEKDLYNQFFSLEKNKSITYQIDNELKKLEEGQYDLLSLEFKKVDLLKNLVEQVKPKKNFKRSRDGSFLNPAKSVNNCPTIETEYVADPGNLNLSNSSIDRNNLSSQTAVVDITLAKKYGNDESSENREVGFKIIECPSMEKDPDNHQVENELMKTLSLRSISNDKAANHHVFTKDVNQCPTIETQYVADPGNLNDQVDNEFMKTLSLRSIAKDTAANHQVFTKDVDNPSGEEIYYEEIFNYLTSVEHFENQMNKNIDDYLKDSYPLWNTRQLSKDALEMKLMTRFKIDITYRSLNGLEFNNWIRDDIICCMVEIINLMFYCINDEQQKPTVHCWNTFLFSKLFENDVYDYNFVKRWTKRMDTFDFKKMFFPINIRNNHWTLVYCEINSKTMIIHISFYDSFGPNNDSKMYCLGIKMWFESEFQKRNLVNKYSYILKDKSIKQQFDGFNCGVIVIQNMIHLAFGRNIKVYDDPQELSRLRSLIAFICTDKSMQTVSFISKNNLNLDTLEKDMMEHRSGSSTSLKSIEGQTPVDIERISIIDYSCIQEEESDRYSDEYVSATEYLKFLQIWKKLGI
jgi:Ulp1 family protease